MSIKLISALNNFGIEHEQATAIAADIEQQDARSLLNELLLRGLWSMVVDENRPELLPKLGGAAVQRLLASGVDPDDLLDVVRETQIDTIESVAQLLDWPGELADLPDEQEVEMAVRLVNAEQAALPLYRLHASLMERDPAGRQGLPRSPAMRQFQRLPDEIRNELELLIHSQQFSKAAILWKSQTGEELKHSLQIVQDLNL